MDEVRIDLSTIPSPLPIWKQRRSLKVGAMEIGLGQ